MLLANYIIIRLPARIPVKKNFRDSLNFFLKLGKIKEMPIIWPFYELQTPDFAWTFVWTVPTDYIK